jgi:hypothetical protein
MKSSKPIEVCIILFFGLLYAVPSTAEPLSVTKLLVDEPASMMDFGLRCLRYEVEEGLEHHPFLKSAKIASVSAYYLDGNDEIDLGTSRMLSTWLPLQEAKTICRTGVENIREMILMFPKSSNGTPSFTTNFLNCFSHKGHKAKNPNFPANMNKEIAKKITISHYIHYQKENGSGETGTLSCKGPLLGEEVRYLE